MTADDFAQSSDAAKVLLWPVRSTNRALPGGARGACIARALFGEAALVIGPATGLVCFQGLSASTVT